MITLVDTFNGKIISQHRTVLAAVKAQRRHMAAVRRRAGEGAFITYAFFEAGNPVDGDEITAVRMALDTARA